MRKLKVIVMAAMAIAAMSAISASAAQGAAFTTGGSGSANITTDADGTGTNAHHVFDVPSNGSITCAAADFKGTVSNGATELTVESDSGKENEPYTTCSFLGFAGAFVKMNGCEFVFKASGAVSVQSKTGKNCTTEPIEFGISGCIGKVGPQNLTGATYTNLASGTEVTLSANVSNIAVSVAGALCLSPGSFTTGQYTTGNTIITGLNDGSAGSHAISVDTP